MLHLKLGRSKKLLPFADYAAASRFYCERRDASRQGASRFPTGLLFSPDGQLLGHISYNGKVWRGSPQTWQPTTRRNGPW